MALCITRRTSRIGIPFYCAAIASIFLIINFAPLGNSIHVYRYTYPILFAAEIGLIGLSLQEQGTKLLKIICVTILLVIAVTQSKNIVNELSNNLKVIRVSITPQPFVEKEILTQYKQAQNIIPEGEPILVMANYPHVFNFTRNKIYLIDLPGTCSPDPGMPMVRDSHLFNNYLRSQGISYIIHNDFNKAFTYCNRKFWNNELVNGEVLVKFMAANFISTMNNLEALDESGYTIGEYGILRVLRIH